MNDSRSSADQSHFVLAVDDDPSDLELIQRVLVRNGYAVRTALSGKEAISLMEQILPAVLILDVAMPGMSGYDLCSFLKRDRRMKDIPVVFLTGQDSPKGFKTGHDVGAIFYVPKSSGLEGVVRAVRTLWTGAKA
jgi:CheY-like chemotaxis protein